MKVSGISKEWVMNISVHAGLVDGIFCTCQGCNAPQPITCIEISWPKLVSWWQEKIPVTEFNELDIWEQQILDTGFCETCNSELNRKSS